ncbi:hypothetical protein JMG10_48740, partial [Nostoc ellipsosporum NOK]|nr:hypothetical protein [Nostoc ellipsosporum NOK]
MFGKRGNDDGNRFKPEFRQPAPAPASAPAPAAPGAAGSADTAVLARPVAAPQQSAPAAQPARRAVEAPPIAPEQKRGREKSETYYDTKSQVFSALIDTIDLSQLAKLDPESAREEIRDIVNDIIAIKNFAMSISEQEELLEDICND